MPRVVVLLSPRDVPLCSLVIITLVFALLRILKCSGILEVVAVYNDFFVILVVITATSICSWQRSSNIVINFRLVRIKHLKLIKSKK